MTAPLIAANILSIQSHVAYGHVGNASAVFPMQRLGVEVWPIHTVQFSNHTGYGAWRGQVFDGASITALVEGIGERGVLGRCDGLLSGYMGSSDIGEAILDAAARVRQANPKALWCCDPVIGDVGRGVFVRPGVPEFIRDRALPATDIATPNLFELEFLTGLPAGNTAELKTAATALQAAGPKVVLVTSAATADTPDDAMDMVAAGGGRFWRVRTPRLDAAVNGAGDMVAALFFVHYLATRDPAAALSAAAASVHGVLARTIAAGSREILAVAAQEEYVAPSRRFAVEEV